MSSGCRCDSIYYLSALLITYLFCWLTLRAFVDVVHTYPPCLYHNFAILFPLYLLWLRALQDVARRGNQVMHWGLWLGI